jgi:hypothetical protein
MGCLLFFTQGKKMIEMLQCAKKNSTGLIVGNESMGYYGEVLPSKFISGDALATAIGLTVGTAINSTEGWLKFSYGYVNIYIAKKPFRYNLTWAEINNRGAVYGEDKLGTPAKAQVVIGGKTYNVRVIRVANSDPVPLNGLGNSEYFDLLVRVNKSVNGSWPLFTNTDLGFVTGFGSRSWAREALSTNTAQRFMVQSGNLYGTALTTARSTDYAWRPVLEEVVLGPAT